MATNYADYKAYDYAKAYQEAEKQQRAALNAAYNKAAAEIDYQRGQLAPQYDAQRSNIYTTARLGAIGNNEALASRGLAGNLYNQPTTGYSEATRIRQDVAMQNALNAARLQEQQQIGALEQQRVAAGYDRDAALANYLGDAARQRAAAEAQERLNAYNTNLNKYQWQTEQAEAQRQYNQSYALQQAQLALDKARQNEAVRQYNTSLAWEKAQAQLQQQTQQQQYAQQQAYTKAVNELNTFGKVMTRESAAALGVPVGTTSFAYQQAVQAAQATGGGGGGGGRRSGGGGGGSYSGDLFGGTGTTGTARVSGTAGNAGGRGNDASTTQRASTQTGVNRYEAVAAGVNGIAARNVDRNDKVTDSGISQIKRYVNEKLAQGWITKADANKLLAGL